MTAVSEPRIVDPELGVERTRALTGMWAVIWGDAVILGVCLAAVFVIKGADEKVSILTAAFTAISTMTTAYFGIKAVSNTARAHIASTAVHEPIAASQTGPVSGPTGGGQQ